MKAKELPTKLAIALVRLYQVTISPLKRLFFGPNAGCRFYPTCSEYARQALVTHGLLKGGWMALKRILSCHPFHPGGLDPVPPKSASKCCNGDDKHTTQSEKVLFPCGSPKRG
ncbi:membrane protein insertion efficiency factor YidD [Rubellicoccus peritrichatus]|uniref:Putative membrane protein insertion efficiency factor n=1 Tax=Rubellicoccus peritrichatus TaxID=3080537 RepID=A0AAQ3LE96_9BACT|nr:membrane protein insertion efficiency factor YidD [Puniceicoccus sp. CR14]WOO41998.1 membrane protein insertion efficiency factor YidD [Puniceicoccus sp. CR14]